MLQNSLKTFCWYQPKRNTNCLEVCDQEKLLIRRWAKWANRCGGKLQLAVESMKSGYWVHEAHTSTSPPVVTNHSRSKGADWLPNGKWQSRRASTNAHDCIVQSLESTPWNLHCRHGMTRMRILRKFPFQLKCLLCFEREPISGTNYELIILGTQWPCIDNTSNHLLSIAFESIAIESILSNR